MASQHELIVNFLSPCGTYGLTFDDDGKVAYSYLKRAGEIVGDVWLYNRCPTPEAPEWKDRSNMPFANCIPYMNENSRMKELVELEDVKVVWKDEANHLVAHIYIFDELYGVVGVGDKPGRARFATKDGPLAKVMHFAD